jgi:hypothetical protein
MMTNKLYPIIAVVAAAACVLASLEPKFMQVGGAPLAMAIVAAGFAIAGNMRR